MGGRDEGQRAPGPTGPTECPKVGVGGRGGWGAVTLMLQLYEGTCSRLP